MVKCVGIQTVTTDPCVDSADETLPIVVFVIQRSGPTSACFLAKAESSALRFCRMASTLPALNSLGEKRRGEREEGTGEDDIGKKDEKKGKRWGEVKRRGGERKEKERRPCTSIPVDHSTAFGQRCSRLTSSPSRETLSWTCLLWYDGRP